MTTPEREPLADAALRAAAVVERQRPDYRLTGTAARAVFPLLHSIAGIVRAVTDGRHTEPLGLLGARTRVLVDAVLADAPDEPDVARPPAPPANFGRDAAGRVAHVMLDHALDALIGDRLHNTPPCPRFTPGGACDGSCPRCTLSGAIDDLVEGTDWRGEAETLLKHLVTHCGAQVDPTAPDAAYPSVRDELAVAEEFGVSHAEVVASDPSRRP